MNEVTLTATEAAERVGSGRALLIDVRTPIEFATVHAEGSRNIPLDGLDAQAMVRQLADDQALIVICKSGARADKACRQLREVGCDRVFSVEGGLDAWMAAGLPVQRRKVISLERQVRIGAGLLVLVGVGLGRWVHPWLLGIAAFVGAGLVVAGMTNFCGMAMLLARAPWNRVAASGDGGGGTCVTSCAR